MKKILLLLCLAPGLFAADVATQLAYNLGFHQTYFVSKKDLKKAPPPITADGKFKMTGHGDLFSRAMDAWGIKLLGARQADDVITLLPVIETWAKGEEAKIKRMETVLAGIITTVPAGRIGSGKKLPGEFSLFLGQAAAGKPENLVGVLRRTRDLDRWLILNMQWLQQHVKLIQQYEKEFREGWSPLGVHGTLFGTSLVQRLYDIGEIQVLAEDLLLLNEEDRTLYAQQADTPVTLGAQARAFYSLLKEEIPPQALVRLNYLLDQPYEISYINAQFKRYFSAAKGPAFCARKLGEAVTALHARNPDLTALDLAEVLNYRQGEIYCGYKPDTRFHDQMFAISDLSEAKDIRTAGEKAVKDFFAYYKKNMSYGQSFDIDDSFTRKSADCFRMANFTGAALANRGWAGIFPMRRHNHSFVGLKAGDTIVTCDPSGGRVPGKTFPEEYIAKGDTAVECYTRTIGGWVTMQALVRPQDPVITFEIPYLDSKAIPGKSQITNSKSQLNPKSQANP